MGIQWKNWSGSVNFQPETLAFPTNEAEVAELVQHGLAESKTIRVVGAGHSFSPLVDQAQILVSLDKMTGLIEADQTALTATVWAGTRLKVLGEILHEHGMAMENLGDIDAQSVAGAISTGTHGTGIALGTIATQVLGITLVTGKGEILTCSASMHPEIFKAAQISLGSLGIITRLTLRLVPAYKLKYTSKKANLSDVLAKLGSYKQQNRNFEFFWFPYTQTVQTREMNLTQDPPIKGGIGKWLNDIVLENGIFWLLSQVSRFIPATSIAISKVSAWGISAGKKTSWSHQVFATPRYVKFQEMEYNIPAEHFQDVLLEIEKTILEKKFRVHFPIECRWVKADDIWLSPAYGRDSAYLAVHMYKGMPYQEYFAAMEAIFKKYDGRPHWGKMNRLQAQDAEARYPKWPDFQKIREDLDPKGVFLNPHLKKLFRKE